jgi:serine/threonine protein kinase
MSETVDPFILSILVRRRELLEKGHDPTPEELCRNHPERVAEVRQAIYASDKREGWAGSLETPQGDETGPFVPMASVPLPQWAEFGSRLQNVRPFAKGGMGEVLLADDPSLDSPVIVKVIHLRLAVRPEMVARFLWEARVTAKLNHPSIPPVHGIGRMADGRPCYSMRFIAGRELGQAINESHCTGAGLRKLLHHFVSICQTVAYAHEQGVIHRDLKPRNVRIGQFGETIVLDWGLARQHGQAPPGTDERGSVLGTDGYMPPEQADGRQEDVDERSDVYSLGAILRDIVGKHAPKPLAAIVARATEKLPSRRYPTAQALGQDVSRWLMDEPVSVFPDSIPVRLARRARKNPILTTASAVAIVGLAIGVPVLLQQQAKTAMERDEKETARKAAVASERTANQETEKAIRERNEKEVARKAEALGRGRLWLALEETADTIHPLLEKQKELRKEDRELLEILLRLSERAAESAPDDVESQMKKGRMQHKIAFIHLRLGNRTQAEKTYRESIKTEEKVCKQRPDDMEYCQNLAATWDHLGNLLKDDDQLPEAGSAYESALKERKRLLASDPRNARFRHEIGMSLNHIGQLQRALNRPADAEKSLQESFDILSEIHLEQPENNSFRETLAHAINNRAGLRLTSGGYAEALKGLREALAHYDRLTAGPNDRNDSLFNKSTTLRAIALISAALGEMDQAEKDMREASAIQAGVYTNLPGHSVYRDEYCNTLERRAILLLTLGRPVEAEEACRALLKVIEAVNQRLRVEDVRLGAKIQFLLGLMFEQQNKDKEALAEFDRATERLDPLLRGKLAPVGRELQAAILIQRALALHKLKRGPEAEKVLEQAAKMSESANPARQFERAVALVRMGRVEQGLAETEKLLDSKTRSSEGKPLSPQKWFYAALAFARASESATPEGENWGKRAVELLRRAKENQVFRSFDDLWLLRTDESVVPLRRRADFKQFVNELDAELKK